MKPLSQIDAIPIFEDVQKELVTLLKKLSKDEWEHPTSSSLWNVKDVAGHLLDGDIRRLSLHRDRYIYCPISLRNLYKAINPSLTS